MQQKGYGFMETGQDLSDLEVLVLGVVNHDKQNPFGKDVIKAYWEEWLESMNVKRFEIHDADLPVHTETVIKNFLDNNI